MILHQSSETKREPTTLENQEFKRDSIMSKVKMLIMRSHIFGDL